jgi:hypothetical protein
VGRRFNQIGTGGGSTGMNRFEDPTTGDFFGMKYEPGEFYLSGSNTPTIEYMANDISQIMGFDPMSMRIIRNADGSESLVTELAQNIYGGDNVFDAFKAEEVGLTARVPVQERLRMSVLDAIIDNYDRNDGNYLFGVNADGSVRLIPIDHGLSFSPEQHLLADAWKEKKSYSFESPSNTSTYAAYKANPTQLRKDLVNEIVKLQEIWRGQDVGQMKNKFNDLVAKQTNPGKPRSVYHDYVSKGADRVIARAIEFTKADPEALVDHIMEQLSNALGPQVSVDDILGQLGL